MGHEVFMAGVVVAHGGHKGDIVPGRMPGAALGRKLLRRSQYLHIKVL